MSVLEVKVGEPIEAGLARFGETLTAALVGQPPAPYFGIGFRTMAQFGEVFTPKRWELVETLKAAGPLSIYMGLRSCSGAITPMSIRTSRRFWRGR
jgi:predicted transcriptional regulator